jgi:hypothetical protein
VAAFNILQQFVEKVAVAWAVLAGGSVPQMVVRVADG